MKYTFWVSGLWGCLLVVECLLGVVGCDSPQATVEEQRQAQVSQAIAQAGDLTSFSFEQLKEHIDSDPVFAGKDDSNPHFVRREIVARWAKAHAPAELEPEAVEWALMQMLPEYLGDYPPEKIEAIWEAQLTPPANGEYTLSISPQNLTNTREEGTDQYFRLWTKVEVDGKTVLDSGPGKRMETGQPIQLQQDAPVSLRYTLRYESLGYSPLPAAGQLYWSGPGMTKQIVAPDHFRTPDNPQPGVSLQVTHVDKFGTHSCAMTVNAIDQILGKHAIVEYEQVLNDYIESRVNHLLSDSYLRQRETHADGSQLEPHPLLAIPDYRGVMSKCSSELRQLVARTLAAEPKHVAAVDVWNMVYFYDTVRFGAEQAAVDLLATWLNAHANRYSEMTTSRNEYFEANIKPFRHLLIPMVIEHPASADWLENNHLVLEDGTCSIPTATVLTYINVVNLRLPLWIAKLDHRLEDEALTGEKRVNWLIARALAEELRYSPPNFVQFAGYIKLDAGLPWFNQAIEAAESQATKDRVVREIAARFAALGRLNFAAEAISEQPGLEDLKSAIAQYTKPMDGKVNTAEPSRTLLAELQQRQMRADERGDQRAAANYAAYIRKLELERSTQRKVN